MRLAISRQEDHKQGISEYNQHDHNADADQLFQFLGSQSAVIEYTGFSLKGVITESVRPVCPGQKRVHKKRDDHSERYHIEENEPCGFVDIVPPLGLHCETGPEQERYHEYDGGFLREGFFFSQGEYQAEIDDGDDQIEGEKGRPVYPPLKRKEKPLHPFQVHQGFRLFNI